MRGIIQIISLLLSIFLPEPFIKEITSDLKKPLEIKDEKKEWGYLPKIVGRLERFIYWWFLFLFPSDQSKLFAFIVFWISLQTYGGKELWSKSGEDIFKYHRGRALFIVFLIGKVLSVLSVIIIYYLFPYIIFC